MCLTLVIPVASEAVLRSYATVPRGKCAVADMCNEPIAWAAELNEQCVQGGDLLIKEQSSFYTEGKGICFFNILTAHS